MPKYFKQIILILFIACSSLYSQNTFTQEIEKDTIYRYNTSLRVLDSLLKKSFTHLRDTAFYSSFNKAEVIDLDRMIFFAVDNNPQLKAMQYRIDAERFHSKEFTALPDPMFEAEADMVSTNFKKVGEINFYGSQTFPFPGKLGLAEKSALLNADMIEQEHHNMETEIINMIKKNYYDLYFANQKIQINLDNQQIIKTFVAASEARYSVGKGMQQELFKTQIELAKLVNEENILRQEKKNLLSELTKLTKIRLDENTRFNFSEVDKIYLTYPYNFQLDDNDVTRLVDYAFQSRADLKVLEKKILMSKTDLERSKLDWYPDLNIKLGYKILPFEENNAFNVMLGINLPFAPWSAGRYEHRVLKNEVYIKSAEEEYRNKQNEIRNEIQAAVNDLNSQKRTLDFSYNVLIPQTENSLKSTQYNYETNLTNILDLLDSYKSYQEAKLMYYESLDMYLKVIADLDRLSGMNFKNIEMKMQ